MMKCPFCNRQPNQIPEYQEHSKQFEMSAEQYVMMEDATFDENTDMFCCRDCYFGMGCPSINNLYQMYRAEFVNVIPMFV